MPELNPVDPVHMQIEKVSENTKSNQKVGLKDLALKFQDLINEECLENEISDKVIETKLSDLLQKAQMRVNIRRNHNHLVQQQKHQLIGQMDEI